MIWKAIGQSVTGTSHTATDKGCEDAVAWKVLTGTDGADILVCCVSDGAGSASHAAFASNHTVDKVIELAGHLVMHNEELTEACIYAMAEDIYYGLELIALENEVSLNEYSCTMLGCILTSDMAAFFQIGDGAIIRNDANGAFHTVWWPQNGEYHNTTSFLVDDSHLGNLQVTIIQECITEIALFTDGLQMLTLNMDSQSVYEPFFNSLFGLLRKSKEENELVILNRRLKDYLNSTAINDRTDDDKTLLLATRINQ